MEKRDYSQLIVHALLGIINDYENRELHDLAIDILMKREILRNASLEKSAMILNVSESSLNHFCKKLGFKNFSTFRMYLDSYDTDDDNDFYQKAMSSNDYGKRLQEALMSLDEKGDELFKKTASYLYRCKKPCIFTYSGYKNQLRFFQESMAMYNKIVRFEVPIIEVNEHNLVESDLLIVLSLHANMYLEHQELIDRLKVPKILITQSDSYEFDDKFNLVLRISDTDIKGLDKYLIERVFEKTMINYVQLVKN